MIKLIAIQTKDDFKANFFFTKNVKYVRVIYTVFQTKVAKLRRAKKCILFGFSLMLFRFELVFFVSTKQLCE